MGRALERHEVERRLRELGDRCRQAGMNLTPQRLAIYRALVMATDHPSPEALYGRVKPRMPSLSLATLYKTLEALVELGLLRELPATGQRRRYDAKLDRHHHLVCTHCGSVADLEAPALDRVKPPEDLGGFTPQHVSIHVLGLCRDCGPAGRSH
jgi:Fur family peroxide stress response transcriptional regulator